MFGFGKKRPSRKTTKVTKRKVSSKKEKEHWFGLEEYTVPQLKKKLATLEHRGVKISQRMGGFYAYY